MVLSSTRRGFGTELGVTGRVPGYETGVPYVAADASLRENGRVMGLGWLGSDGRWGMRLVVRSSFRSFSSAAVHVAELAAALSALALVPGASPPCVLATDSEYALKWLRSWLRDGELPEMWASEPVLVSVTAAAAAGANPGLRLVKARSHHGHMLHEGADALAARAASGSGRTASGHYAAEIVPGYLSAWHAGEGHRS